MARGFRAWLAKKITTWLTEEKPADRTPLCDFERLLYEIRPGDVVLVEGRTRVSDIIKTITQSPWTHTALYLGRIGDIDDPRVREHVSYCFDGDPNAQLVVEALLGQGTIVSDLHKYRNDHLRICRPNGLSRRDAQAVIAYAVNHLGCDYDVRQLLDLARFLFPYSILPRRWRSSLFEHNAGVPTRTVCSSMIAAAFDHVHFPMLPVMRHLENGEVRLYKRNARLYTPRDFDYSPYFEIIKYPYLGIQDKGLYRSLPWDEQGQISNDEGQYFAPLPQKLALSGSLASALADATQGSKGRNPRNEK
ncbi:MAG: YiiX/YebB-like N1pC/P60 family cysteine hydrolase [Gammaproteobacteria bacterium]